MRDTVTKKGKNVYDISKAASVAKSKKAVSHSARKKRRIAFVVIVGLIALLPLYAAVRWDADVSVWELVNERVHGTNIWGPKPKPLP